MINRIAPDASAMIFPENRIYEDAGFSDPLLIMLFAAMYNNPHGRDLDMLCDILPYINVKDRSALESLLSAKEQCIDLKNRRRIKRELKRGCLSPSGNISRLICVLKRYSSPEGQMFFNRIEQALDTARIIGALSDNPDPAELMRFMGMGDISNMMSMLPKMMQMFGGNE